MTKDGLLIYIILYHAAIILFSELMKDSEINQIRHAAKSRAFYFYEKTLRSSKTSLTIGFTHTGERLDKVTDGKLKFSLENNMRGGLPSCMGNRHLKGRKKIQNEGLSNSYGCCLSQHLPAEDFQEIYFTLTKGKKIVGNNFKNSR